MANNKPAVSSTPESTSPSTSPPASASAPASGFTNLSTRAESLPPPLPPAPAPAPKSTQPSSAKPSEPSEPPAWARPTHYLETRRLILRTAKPEDAEAFTVVWRDERNSPFGGVVGSGLSLDEQREKLRSQAASTARGENGWMVVLLKPHLQDILESSNLSPPDLEALHVTDGYLIGMTGYNSFTLVNRKPTQILNQTLTQNSSQSSFQPEAKDKRILEADTGTLTHHPFTRHGLGMETLQAVISYAFASLGVESITLETARVNKPFVGLMRGMGLAVFEGPGSVGREGEVKGEGKEDGLVKGKGEEEMKGEEEQKKPKPDHGLGDQESIIFRFSQRDWEGAKAGMKERGRWYLD